MRNKKCTDIEMQDDHHMDDTHDDLLMEDDLTDEDHMDTGHTVAIEVIDQGLLAVTYTLDDDGKIVVSKT